MNDCKRRWAGSVRLACAVATHSWVLETAFLLGLVLVFAGCNHAANLPALYSKGQGTTRSYAVASDQAWTISESILREAGAETVEEHQDKRYMLASTSVGAGLSVGTKIGVWIEPDESGQTKITVITRRKTSAQIVTALTEGGFHRKFEAALGLKGSDKPAEAAASKPQEPSPPDDAPPPARQAASELGSVPANSAAQPKPKSPAGLKTIDNPGGGRIVYGPLIGSSSLQNGMIAMLREVHGLFGDRPQVEKFFQAKGGDSVATFFAVNAKQQGSGTRPISGLIIVSMPQGSNPAAAVLYDDSARFPKTEPAMMQELNRAWHAASPRPTSHASSSGLPNAIARQAAPQPLRMTTGGDRSAAIGLPSGWQLTVVSGGQVSAKGPNGEMVEIDMMYQQIHDPRRTQNQRFPYFGGAGGAPLVYPMGGDLFGAFASLTNQIRRNGGLSQGTYKLTSSQPLPASQYGPQAIQAMFEVDFHDGKGVRKGSARLSPLYTQGADTWALGLDTSNAPATVADAEAPTMLAIIHSYTQNAAVIAGEQRAVMDRIQDTVQAARIQADTQHAADDAQKASFEAHMDDIDRYSKSFQNYQFDRSQLQDNDFNERGTIGNMTADALVKADPNRFEIVPPQNFIKGVDY